MTVTKRRITTAERQLHAIGTLAAALEHRWPDKPTAERGAPVKVFTHVPCAARCGDMVNADPQWNPDAVTCGSQICRARVEWTDERWAGAARMADSRRAAGLPLTVVDLEALDRRARR